LRASLSTFHSPPPSILLELLYSDSVKNSGFVAYLNFFAFLGRLRFGLTFNEEPTVPSPKQPPNPTLPSNPACPRIPTPTLPHLYFVPFLLPFGWIPFLGSGKPHQFPSPLRRSGFAPPPFFLVSSIFFFFWSDRIQNFFFAKVWVPWRRALAQDQREPSPRLSIHAKLYVIRRTVFPFVAADFLLCLLALVFFAVFVESPSFWGRWPSSFHSTTVCIPSGDLPPPPPFQKRVTSSVPLLVFFFPVPFNNLFFELASAPKPHSFLKNTPTRASSFFFFFFPSPQCV